VAAALAADAVIPVDAVDLAVVPAAGSGSSFFCAAAAALATVTDAETTAACGSSFSCAAAAASAAATAAAVTANFKTDGGVIHPAVFYFFPC